MRQNEFLQELETGLSGQLPPDEVKDILTDYRSFFASGVGEGKSEEDICTLLGSPAALVRSLTGTEEQPQQAVPKQTTGIPHAPLGKRVAATLIDRLVLVLVYGAVLIPFIISYFSAQSEMAATGPTVGMTLAPGPLLMIVVLLIGLPFSPLTLLPFTVAVSLLVNFVLWLLDMGPGTIIGIVPLFYVLLFALFSLYKPVVESLCHGQTIGKRLMRIRVIGLDGQPAAVSAVWRRELLGDFLLDTVTLGITPLVSACLAAGKSGRSLPDRIGDTVVVETDPPRKP